MAIGDSASGAAGLWAQALSTVIEAQAIRCGKWRK